MILELWPLGWALGNIVPKRFCRRLAHGAGGGPRGGARVSHIVKHGSLSLVFVDRRSRVFWALVISKALIGGGSHALIDVQSAIAVMTSTTQQIATQPLRAEVAPAPVFRPASAAWHRGRHLRPNRKGAVNVTTVIRERLKVGSVSSKSASAVLDCWWRYYMVIRLCVIDIIWTSWLQTAVFRYDANTFYVSRYAHSRKRALPRRGPTDCGVLFVYRNPSDHSRTANLLFGRDATMTHSILFSADHQHLRHQIHQKADWQD